MSNIVETVKNNKKTLKRAAQYAAVGLVVATAGAIAGAIFALNIDKDAWLLTERAAEELGVLDQLIEKVTEYSAK